MADNNYQAFATQLMCLAGCEAEILEIPSGNPANFYEAISHPAKVPEQVIVGQLFLPRRDSNPVVIIVPGSLGIADSHVGHGEALVAAGIGVLLLDPFGPRQVTSTVANQAQYSFAASSQDVVAAAARLAGHAGVDPCRIGAQGHSRGGTAVLNAAVSLFPGNDHLNAVYAAYPWCGMQFLHPATGRTKVRSIVGDRDEWCLPQQVQACMHAMTMAGSEASVRIVPGAHHSFDRGTAVTCIEDASVAPSAPTIYLEDDGRYIHPVEGACDEHATERDLMLYGIRAGYGVRGANIGTKGTEHVLFREDMMSFWTDVMKEVD